MSANNPTIDNLPALPRHILPPLEVTLRWLNIQGYQDFTLAERRSFSLGLRMTTGLCTIAFGTAVILQSAALLLVLAGVAVSAAACPRHPFDAIWQYGVRHLVRGAALPRNPVERRLSFLVSGLCVAGIALLVLAGWNGAAYATAVPMMAACIAVTGMHFCTPGTMIAAMRGRLHLFAQPIASSH